MATDSGVKVRALALITVGSGLVCWVLLSLWRNAGNNLPLLPWLSLVPLLLLSVLVLFAGWQVRRAVQLPGEHGQPRVSAPPRPVRRPMTSQRARGTLVAAQAAGLGGAVLVGWYLANALLALPNADVTSVRELMLRALTSAGGALLLVVSGMVAQWMCRVPPSDDDDDDREEGYDPMPM